MVGRDLGSLLFLASDSELETSDCGRFHSVKVFKMVTCASRSGISSGRRVAPRGPNVVEAPGWALGVVISRGKHLVWTNVIILMRVKF